MPLQFRAAAPDDAVECVRIRARTRENAIPEARLESAGITAASWARDIEDGSLPGFVCESEGTIVGYCFGARDTGEVVVLALLPEFECRGLGRLLLAMMVEALRGDGHRRLFLGCSPDASCRAWGFYRHLGWKSTGTFDQFGDEVLELVSGDKFDEPSPQHHERRRT
jgi:ribosomal protein S18 acetylase RimI-like enzyme